MVLFGGCVWFYSGGACVVLFGGCMVLFERMDAWMHGFIRGACVVLFGGMHGFIRGVHGFIWGGMRGFIRGVCVVLFWGGMRGFIRGMHGFIRGACMVSFGGCVWFYSGGCACFFQFFRIQSDTVNERAVRILLECILVEKYVFMTLRSWGLELGTWNWAKGVGTPIDSVLVQDLG